MAELSVLMALVAIVSCAFVYSQMRKQLKDMERTLLASAEAELTEGLSDEVQQLVCGIQAASQVAAESLNQQVTALRRLTESAAIQIEALHSACSNEPTIKPVSKLRSREPEPRERSTALASGRADVITLANQGKTTTDIAREVGMSRGEVDLLLQFYKRSSQSTQ